MGLKPDLGLKGGEYQWLGSLFYFGMLAYFDTIDHWYLTRQATWLGNILPIDSSNASLWENIPQLVS